MFLCRFYCPEYSFECCQTSAIALHDLVSVWQLNMDAQDIVEIVGEIYDESVGMLPHLANLMREVDEIHIPDVRIAWHTMAIIFNLARLPFVVTEEEINEGFETAEEEEEEL